MAASSAQQEQFTAAYERLNPQQRQAVDTIEGPVMVVAGPGTGKTQVIALRVANILKRTQMRPSNILCLTFSVSGATAMRERLRRYIGADAYGVTVKNFHGFCNDLIIEHPLIFESWSALEPISDVDRYRSLNKIIDQLLPELELINPKSPHGRTGDILSRISQIKREGCDDPERLEAVAAEYDQQMANKSREGTKAHAANLLAARKFRDLIKIFLAYEQMLRDTQRYDYDDMILFVLQALRENEWLLQTLQERYQYILVDEFQDTNGAQQQLVDLLTTYPTLDHQPNIFVVGDDDQAIYRFQGANLQNILAFRDRYPSAAVIPLTTSYRCAQSILDAAGSLIANNDERLVGRIDGLTKDLVSGQSSESATQPQLLLAASDELEPWLIAQEIEKRLQSGTEPSEIAVLVQTNSELISLYDVLQAAGIPVHMSGKLDLLRQSVVRQAVIILQAIHQLQDNHRLSAALACDCFGLHPADIARLNAASYRPGGESVSLYTTLLSLDADPEESLTELKNKKQILYTRDTLLSLSQKIDSRTLVDTLEHLLKETGLLPTDNTDALSPFEFAAIQTFFNRLKNRSYEQPGFDSKALLSDIDYYLNSEYRELRMSFEPPHAAIQGVQLMTAHQSKGLEFDVVIMANMRHGHWDSRRAPVSVSVPEDLLFGWESKQRQFERTQDERRVAYVAMTRARNELIFTCAQQLASGDRLRDVSPSLFVAESGNVTETEAEVAEPERASTLLRSPTVDIDEAMKAFLHQRLEHYALSATGLNRFLEDPQLFLQLDLLAIPQAKELAFAYGNAVHHTLNKWALLHQKGEEMSETAFLDFFRRHLEEKELLTSVECARLQQAGSVALPRYYQERLTGSQAIIHKVESTIVTQLGDARLKGKLDRIDLAAPDSAVATIIDYKTGKPKTEKECVDYGYVRQLTFYALLLEHGAGYLSPESYVLDFIGEREHGPLARTFQITDDSKKELSQIIAAVWQKILALDFSPL